MVREVYEDVLHGTADIIIDLHGVHENCPVHKNLVSKNNALLNHLATINRTLEYNDIVGRCFLRIGFCAERPSQRIWFAICFSHGITRYGKSDKLDIERLKGCLRELNQWIAERYAMGFPLSVGIQHMMGTVSTPEWWPDIIGAIASEVTAATEIIVYKKPL